jgi:hypothetical protein
MAAAKKEKETGQTPLPEAAEPVEEGSPTTINTALFKAFLQFAAVIGDDQVLRFHEDRISFRSRDKGNTTMGIIELNTNFHKKGEVGVKVDQILAAMPKTDMVTLAFGEKISVRGTDYNANFLTISESDPTIKMSRLKKDFTGEVSKTGNFVIGTKDFHDKVVALKSVFKGDPFLALVSDKKEPGILTLTTDDNAVGDVHYRVATSAEIGETWTRLYDYELLIPIFRTISQYAQEVLISWLTLGKPGDKEILTVLVISGQTPDGAITFSYALAPRVPMEGPK